MLSILIIVVMSISTVFGGCGDLVWQVDYSGDKCTKSSGVYKFKCPTKGNTGTCGSRLSSKKAVGKGTFSAKIKAAPGKGMNTAFYLYSYGRYNDKSYAWNEIDIEILGAQISGGKTKIWTNVWTGYYTQHYQLVTVPWDASTGYHTYKITITSTQIKWIFDGKTYRTFTYTGYSDLKSTINNKNFQVLMALWGSNGGWTEMDSMWNNYNSFPLYGYFKSVSIPSSYTEEEESAVAADAATIGAIVIVTTLLICVLIGGFIYFKKRKKRLNGDGASFEEEVADEETDDSKPTAANDTPSGEQAGDATTAGYDMNPIEPEPELEVEVETQA